MATPGEIVGAHQIERVGTEGEEQLVSLGVFGEHHVVIATYKERRVHAIEEIGPTKAYPAVIRQMENLRAFP